jgi:hypothetical protein
VRIINIIIIKIFFISACNCQDANGIINYRIDTIPRVGVYSSNKKVENKLSDTLFYELLAQEIGLPKIQSYKNGLHLRVWLLDFEKQYILDVIIDSFKREYTIIKLSDSVLENTYYFKIENVITGLEPKFGWNKFISQMRLNRIFDLKSGDIQNSKRYNHLTHGVYYGFELVQDGKYNNFKYFEPSFYRIVDSNSRHVFEFLTYLNNIFPIKIYNRNLRLHATK